MNERAESTPFADDECEWMRVPTYEAVKARYERGERRPTRATVGGGPRYMQTMNHWARARRENQHYCPVPTPEDNRRAVNGSRTTCPECGRVWVCRSGETPSYWPAARPVPALWWSAAS